MIDVLIIGAGGAGLVSAIHAKQAGASVQVICQKTPTRSQTSMAQGGINAALNHHNDDDSVEAHISDTLKSSHGIGSLEAIEKLCTEGIDAIKWLDEIGVPFSRDENAKIAQRRLGGASGIRACYAQDYSGLKILHTLYDYANKLGIEFIDEHFLLNFITHQDENSKQIAGATFINLKNGDAEAYYAKTVIVATGGYSRVYHKHSTNATGSTGDGIAAAIRAGAHLSDMEFVQFHPTGLKNSSILISESARGAGGYLVNSKGERFTNELLPRDELSRAILTEIEKGEDIYLDIRHLGEAFINEELPQERKLAKLYENIDPVTDLIPIKPVAHYTMGGIRVDKHSQTSIKNLFAVGECANRSVHGGNRLGGNSLLELIVFGKEAGINAANTAKNLKKFAVNNHQLTSDSNFVTGVKYFTNQIDFYEKREFMGNIFYNNAGIVKDDMGLKAVLGAVRQMQKELPFMGPRDKSKIYNTNLVEFIEFGNMVELAEIILVCAISRVESRGSHYRSDAPREVDHAFKAHTITWKEDGVLCADFVGDKA